MTKAAKRKPKTKPVAKAAKPKSKPRVKRKPRKKPMTTKHEDSDLPKSDKKSGPGNTPGTPEKDPKNLPETNAIGEDPNHKKNTPPPDQQPHKMGHIDNRDQDPNHPANKTAAKDLNAPTTFSIPPEDMLTEQEKDVVGTGGTDATAGVGPVSPAEHTSGPVETIEDQGIGPRTPYPTGNPPPDNETITRSQGVKDPDAPRVKAKPGETTVKKEHV